MTSVKEGQIIEKLNFTNYFNWKFKVEILLIKEDLFDAITETPLHTITTDCSKKDHKAMVIINLSIEDSQITHVKKHLEHMARDTWNALKTIHESSNLSSKLYLLRKLYSRKLAESGTMTNPITKILQITY